MSGYNDFQRILAEMKDKIKKNENKELYSSIPPGFDELFSKLKH